jgi:Transglycosylase-like domain
VRVPRSLRGSLAALLGLALAAAPGGDATAPTSGVDPAHLPGAAREFLPLVTDLTAQQCPELPPVWVVAQVEAESGWDAVAVGGGVAGLLQFDELTWTAAGGAPWPSATPGPGDPVTDAETHLRVAVPWLCGTLRAVEGHLAATKKPTSALDAMLVCHIAGCERVTGSASGVPGAGEAGCSRRCAELVARYLDAVHAHVRKYTAAGPAPSVPPTREHAPVVAPASWTGGPTGCRLPDPTGGRCVTGATKHGLDAAAAAFDGWKGGAAIRSAGCWDRHAWNPRSDHPQGRACDLFATKAGRFADGAELADGWRVAQWFRGHAGPLRVKYVIWQGRYWDPRVQDQDGWGRRYSGGGVYDVRNATGGHYDHVHVSFRE